MSVYDAKTIDEVNETLIDYRGKTPVKTETGVKLITAKVIKNGFITNGNHEYIADNEYDAWMRRGLPKRWDILITTEAPLGEVAQLRTDEKVALAQRIILLRGKPNVIDQSYYFHALKSPYVQGELKSKSCGTTVLGIKQIDLRKVRIPYPPLPTQCKIGAILSAYDDLIENNQRRIKILEEMSQNLYREWFVNFRFPGHEKVKMVDSPLGRIPEGWEGSKLGNIAQEVRRSVNPEHLNPNTPYFGLEHLPRKSITLSECGYASDIQSTKLRFNRGEILFGKIRPYFHKVGVAPFDGICSSDIIVISPKLPKYFALTLSIVSSEEFVNHASQTSKGTKMPRADWDVLIKYPALIPHDDVLTSFNEIIDSIVKLLHNTILKNDNLRQTRDLLLPKLISGELDVTDLDIKVEDTA